jgi:hypothetical protein
MQTQADAHGCAGQLYSHLVFDHLDLDLVAHRLSPASLSDLVLGADVQAHAGVVLERLATTGGLRVAKHDTNLHSNMKREPTQHSKLSTHAKP